MEEKPIEQLYKDYEDICENGFEGTLDDYINYLHSFDNKQVPLFIPNEDDIPF